MSLPKFRVTKTQQIKGYTSASAFIVCNVRIPTNYLGESIAKIISRVLKSNKFTKAYDSHTTARDGETTFFLGDKEDNKFLSTDALTKKSLEKIANDVCDYLNNLKVSYDELKVANIWTHSAEGTKFVVSIEQVEDKSESNKPSNTRVGKILESLNKRSRTLSEGRSDYKIVYYNGRGGKDTDYYNYMERDEFKADAKNIKNHPYGAGAYVLKGKDWRLVAGKDVLNGK